MAKKNLVDEAKKDIEAVLNTVKTKSSISVKKNDEHIKSGESIIYKPNSKKYQIKNFIGKKLKSDYIYHAEDNSEILVKAGTEWEKITPFLKQKVHWKENQFI